MMAASEHMTIRSAADSWQSLPRRSSEYSRSNWLTMMKASKERHEHVHGQVPADEDRAIS